MGGVLKPISSCRRMPEQKVGKQPVTQYRIYENLQSKQSTTKRLLIKKPMVKAAVKIGLCVFNLEHRVASYFWRK